IGTGYTIDVVANASDGVTVCEGTTTFDVSGPTTTVQVHLVCAVPTGDIQVSAIVNVCPVLDGLDAAPTSLLRGGSATLSATEHDSDNGPGPLKYKWSANGAVLKNRVQPSLVFFCTTPGVISIAVSVSDGDPNPSCSDTLSANITCGGQ